MSQGDGKPGPGPAGPDDPLSATGMFLDGFRKPSEEPQDEVLESFMKPSGARPLGGGSEPAAPGEFTRMFGAVDSVASEPPPAPVPSAPPREVPKQSWEEATRIFVPKAAPPPEPREKPAVNPAPVANPPRMRGFSSPGASDSASDEGSFTQVFRTISGIHAASPQVKPIQPLPSQVSSQPPPVEKADWPNANAKPQGATDLLRALSAADGLPERNPGRNEATPNSVFAAVESGNVTNWMKKLSEDAEPQAAAAFTPPAVRHTPPTASDPGEFTRIMNASAGPAAVAPVSPASMSPVAFPAPAVPASPKIQMPAVEASKMAAPQVAAPAVPAPKSKLQELLPILLALNSLLLVVLIVLVVFVLLRK